MRGFSDFTTRGHALSNFYGGPTWAAHKEAANATMVDSDNVLLLRPFEDPNHVREDLSITTGLLRVTIHYLNSVSVEMFLAFWTSTLYPMLLKSAIHPFAH